MNVLKAVKVAEIRKKISVIPAKIIIAVVLTVLIFWDFKNKMNLDQFFSNIQNDPKKFFSILLIAYGAVSYVYFFIRLMHNWIFGVIISAGVAFLVISQAGKLGNRALIIALLIMLFGGPILDIITIIRYNTLKAQVIRAEEERLERFYGEGYDEGYRNGMREARRSERRRIRDDGRGPEGYYEDGRRGRIGYEGENYENDGYGEDYYEDGRRGRIGYGGENYENDSYPEDDDYEGSYYEDGRRGNDYYNNNNRRETGGAGTGGRSENEHSAEYVDAAGFFADCRTPAEIKRRYHDLCKVYHPDSGNGSAELFYRIKTEYDRLHA